MLSQPTRELITTYVPVIGVNVDKRDVMFSIAKKQIEFPTTDNSLSYTLYDIINIYLDLMLVHVKFKKENKNVPPGSPTKKYDVRTYSCMIKNPEKYSNNYYAKKMLNTAKELIQLEESKKDSTSQRFDLLELCNAFLYKLLIETNNSRNYQLYDIMYNVNYKKNMVKERSIVERIINRLIKTKKYTKQKTYGNL